MISGFNFNLPCGQKCVLFPNVFISMEVFGSFSSFILHYLFIILSFSNSLNKTIRRKFFCTSWRKPGLHSQIHSSRDPSSVVIGEYFKMAFLLIYSMPLWAKGDSAKFLASIIFFSKALWALLSKALFLPVSGFTVLVFCFVLFCLFVCFNLCPLGPSLSHKYLNLHYHWNQQCSHLKQHEFGSKEVF